MPALSRPLARALRHPAAGPVVHLSGRLAFGDVPVRARLAGPLVPRERHRVSVVIPSHGYGRYVTAAIRSAATQEGVDVEVIVVDDHSPDDSVERSRAEARRHRAGVVTVLTNATNEGHMRAFDRGVRVATGEFLVRLDADDLLTPGALARAVAVFEQAPQVGLVYGAPIAFRTPVPPPMPRSRGSSCAVVRSGPGWLRHSMRHATNLISTPEAVIRMSTLREVGPWSLDLPHSQDLEIWLRLAAVSDVGYVQGVPQAWKRDHPLNQSNTVGMVGMMYYTAHSEALDVLHGFLTARLPDATRLRHTARRALADEALEQCLRARVTSGGPSPLEAELIAFAREHGASSRASRRVARAVALGPRVRVDPRTAIHRLGFGVRRELRWARQELEGI